MQQCKCKIVAIEIA